MIKPYSIQGHERIVAINFLRSLSSDSTYNKSRHNPAIPSRPSQANVLRNSPIDSASRPHSSRDEDAGSSGLFNQSSGAQSFHRLRSSSSTSSDAVGDTLTGIRKSRHNALAAFSVTPFDIPSGSSSEQHSTKRRRRRTSTSTTSEEYLVLGIVFPREDCEVSYGHLLNDQPDKMMVTPRHARRHSPLRSVSQEPSTMVATPLAKNMQSLSDIKSSPNLVPDVEVDSFPYREASIGTTPPPPDTDIRFSLKPLDEEVAALIEQPSLSIKQQLLAGYHAELLDDPHLVAEKTTSKGITSYIASFIDHTRPSDMKALLNAKFREEHPTVELTLSKLRSIKREMWHIGVVECSLAPYTVATAYVFFEQIILLGLINKPNRKMVAGASLLIAAKLDDTRHHDVKKLMSTIEDELRISREDLLHHELGVMLALEFQLTVSDEAVQAHYARLIDTYGDPS